MGKKWPLKVVVLAAKRLMEWLKNESVTNHSVIGWAESIKWVLNRGDSPRMGEAWRRKEKVKKSDNKMKNINK